MVLVHTRALSGGDEQAHCTCHFRTTKQTSLHGLLAHALAQPRGGPPGAGLVPPMAELHGAVSELTAHGCVAWDEPLASQAAASRPVKRDASAPRSGWGGLVARCGS